MPAAIASDGNIDLFASHREPAWHGLGNVFTEEVTDYRRMLSLAGLADWNIREMPLVVEGAETADWAVTQNAVVATMNGTDRVLGVTGDRYQIVQNEDAFAFLQSLHDGARWETAGALKSGRLVFGSLAFERDFVLDPSGVADVVKSYLMVYTSHDGSTGIGYGMTPVRVVCQNTLNVAISGMKNGGKIRHTVKAEERMREEAALWRNANAYMDQFSEEAKVLFEAPATDAEYFGIVEEFFPKPEKDVKGSFKKWDNQMEKFTQAWKGEANAGIKGTAWGVFNALTEANQWGRKVQNTDRGAENFAAAGAGFDAPTNKFRQDAFAAAKALV